MAIPPKLHSAILEKAGEGLAVRPIVEWLKVEHGVSTNRTSVAKLIRDLRRERAEVAKAVVREELSTTLTADVRRLEHLVKKTLVRIRKATDDDTYCRLVEQTRKLIETKLKHSGAGEADESNLAPVIMVPPESED